MSGKIIIGALKATALATFIGFNMFLAFIIFYMFITSTFMETFYIVWMLILPILAICFMIVAPIFWFLLVPEIARRLTLSRFRPGSLQGIADDTGSFDIIQSKFELPEGVVKNRYAWFTLPRPTFKPLVEQSKKEEEEARLAEHIILKKCILKSIGKPIWFGYSGKMGLVNLATLAALESKPTKPNNPSQQIANIESFASTLSKDIQKPLLRLVMELKEHLNVEPITWIDPRMIREVLPQNYTQSQIDAIAINREAFGRKSQGKDVFKIALLIMVCAVAVIFVIGVLWFLTGGF